MATAKDAAPLLVRRDELLDEHARNHRELHTLEKRLHVLRHARAAALQPESREWGGITRAIHQIIAAGPDEFTSGFVAQLLAAPGGPCEGQLLRAKMNASRFFRDSKIYPIVAGYERRKPYHYTKRGVTLPPADVVEPPRAPSTEEHQIASRCEWLRNRQRALTSGIKAIEDATLLTGTEHGAAIRSVATAAMLALVRWAMAHAPENFTTDDIADIIAEFGPDYRRYRYAWKGRAGLCAKKMGLRVTRAGRSNLYRRP